MGFRRYGYHPYTHPRISVDMGITHTPTRLKKSSGATPLLVTLQYKIFSVTVILNSNPAAGRVHGSARDELCAGRRDSRLSRRFHAASRARAA